jgi:pyruvate dehydrogenase E2 component (dihydrolipoamide acetyltransferase)
MKTATKSGTHKEAPIITDNKQYEQKNKTMRYIFKFPDIGEGLDEGTIAEWYVEKGQLIESGDALVKMETDKVVTDIPSPKSGRIAAIYGKIGEIIKVGSPLVEVEMEGVEGADAVKEATENKLEEVEEAAGVVGTLEVAGNSAFLHASTEGMPEKTITEETDRRTKIIATPVARAMAKDMGIDINTVTGTGPAGRVTTNDVKRFVESGSHSKSTIASVSVSDTSIIERVTIEPLTQIRKTIAKNMINSKHSAAHMTVFEEVEISDLMSIRERFKHKYEEKDVKLSYLPFILKAVALSLKKHRSLNSQLDMENEKMIYKNYYNIGIAVDTPDGLLVPVIRDVDRLSIFELAQKVNEIALKARDRKLSMDDMKDGTFTITNYGSIGGIFAVPVINYPQAAILGIGRLVKKPVVDGDIIKVGNVLPLSLSVDHRIVDGGEVTRFINQVMAYLSDTVSLIME